MAKLTVSHPGTREDFKRLRSFLVEEIVEGSISASHEDGQVYEVGDVDVFVDVFERFSYLGGNRVSLNITGVYNEGEIKLIGITSGGSQAVFFKMNTFGEENFLDKLKEAVDRFFL